jgi:hypothetical protein
VKTKDIKPGVVYGHRRGKYGRIEPAVFLAAPSAEHLFSPNRWAKDGEALEDHGVRTRPNRYGEPTALEIPFDEVEKLLALLPTPANGEGQSS